MFLGHFFTHIKRFRPQAGPQVPRNFIVEAPLSFFLTDIFLLSNYKAA